MVGALVCLKALASVLVTSRWYFETNLDQTPEGHLTGRGGSGRTHRWQLGLRKDIALAAWALEGHFAGSLGSGRTRY